MNMLPKNMFRKRQQNKHPARTAAPVRPRPQRGNFNLRGRLALVCGGLGLCSLALVGRAVDLQLVDNEFYRKQGDERFLRELEIPTTRGMITDRNGEPLAVSTPVESIWANPQELSRNPDRLPQLAHALGVPVDYLKRKVSQRSDKEFMWLQRRMNPALAKRILALDIPGVFSQREFRPSTRKAKRWRTCSASPTSTTSARRASSSRSTTGCAASLAWRR